MKENLEFIECIVCASKPGSPVLCPSCLSNRQVISRLKQQLIKAEKFRRTIIAIVEATEEA